MPRYSMTRLLLLFAAVAALATLAVWLALPSTAHAQELTPDVESTSVAQIKIGAVLVAWLAVLAPAVVGILTKAGASDFLANLVNVIVSGVWGFIANAITDDGSAVFSQQAFLIAGSAIAASVISYWLAWRPIATDLAGKRNVSDLFGGDFGLGKAA